MRKLIVFLVIIIGVIVYYWGFDGILNGQTIHVILQDKTDNPFWAEVISGAKAAGKGKCSLKIDGPGEEIDYLTQVQLIKSAVRSKADAIVIAPINRKLVVDELAYASSVGIKIIIIDSAISFPAAKTTVESDNYAIGELAAEYIADDGGKVVVIIRGVNGDPSHDSRVLGCKTVLSRHGIEVKWVLVADSDKKKACDELKNVLRLRNNDVDSVFATNDEMALGAAQAVKESQVKNIHIVGVDGTASALAAIQSGEISASIAQDPYAIGRIGVESAIKALQNEGCPPIINTNCAVVSKSGRRQNEANVGNYEITQQHEQNTLMRIIETGISRFQKYISDSTNINTIIPK